MCFRRLNYTAGNLRTGEKILKKAKEVSRNRTWLFFSPSVNSPILCDIDSDAGVIWMLACRFRDAEPL